MNLQDLHPSAHSAHLSAADIAAYLDGTLSPEAVRAIELHLSDCALCSDAVAGYHEHWANGDVRKALASPPPPFRPTAPVAPRVRWLSRKRLAFAAAALIFGALLLVYWPSPQQPSPLAFASEPPPIPKGIGLDHYAESATRGAMYSKPSSSLPSEANMAAELKTAVAKHPGNLDARYALGMHYLHSGQAGKALTELEAVRHSDSEFATDATFNLALAHLEVGDKEQARQLLIELREAGEGWRVQPVLDAFWPGD